MGNYHSFLGAPDNEDLAQMISSAQFSSKTTFGELRDLLPLDPNDPTGDKWQVVFRAFRERFEERFFAPIDHLLSIGRSFKPGFAILALDCLLIDALQGFREGRTGLVRVSTSHSLTKFLELPSFSPAFSNRLRKEFVNSVRNGLLHDGETRKSWLVRTGQEQIVARRPDGAVVLDRTRFHRAVRAEYESYLRLLEKGPAQPRAHFLRRLEALCGVDVARKHIYFAYGSNLLDAELHRTAPGAAFVGIAYVPGWSLAFRKHSATRGGDAATIEPCPSRMVWGALYSVTPSDWKQLEERERGYKVQRITALTLDETHNHEQATATLADTFVAEATCPTNCGPTRQYVSLVIEGAREKRLPEAYIEQLERLA